MFVISVDSLNGTSKIKIGKSRIGTHRRDLMGVEIQLLNTCV